MTPELGTPLAYVYDSLSRLTQIQLGSPDTSYSYSYEGISPLVQNLTRPNGSITAYAYNAIHQLTEIANLSSSGEIITTHSYNYNGQDLRSSETLDGPAIPELPVLSEVEGLAFTEHETTYTHNAVNQMVSTSDPAQSFGYDADGNLTKGYTKDGFVFTASYDAENRMTSLEYIDQTGVLHRQDFQYSGDDSLAVIRHYANGELVDETCIVRDGFLALQDRNDTNAIVNEYTWGLNLGGGIGGLLRSWQFSHVLIFRRRTNDDVSRVAGIAGQSSIGERRGRI